MKLSTETRKSHFSSVNVPHFVACDICGKDHVVCVMSESLLDIYRQHICNNSHLADVRYLGSFHIALLHQNYFLFLLFRLGLKAFRKCQNVE